ncbi:MAG: hypothetical protein BIFFINMI_03230 [Phycisphaerae bacterium]|nr:hypothetical protein [Phycisphaerae bacterium]
MRPRAIHYVLGLGALAVLVLGLIYPLVQMLGRGFTTPGPDPHFTLDYVWMTVSYWPLAAGLINAVKIALATTAVVCLIAMPLAVLSDRYHFRGKTLLSGLLLVPMILPPFVGAIGLRQILARYGGSLNLLLQQLGLQSPANPIDWLGAGRFWGIVILEALHLYPIMYLNLTASLANIDPTMSEAAANLGAGPWRRFRKVTLPLMMPGLFAGASIVLIWSFTELGTPLMFDYRRHTAVQIFERLSEYRTSPLPFAMVAVMLTASLLIYGASKLLLARRRTVAVSGKATIAASARRLGPGGSLLAALPFVLVIGLAIVPHIGVVLTSVAGDWFNSILPGQWTLAHYHDALGHELTLPSIANSMKYAGAAMLVDLALGLLIAYLVVRVRIRGGWILDSLAMLPLAVPGLVLAFGFVATTLPGGLLSFINLEQDPTLLLIFAYAIRRLPYVVRASAAGLEQSPVTLEEAAANLGAPPRTVLRRVTVPLIAANLMAGALLAFSFAMLEVSDSLVLARKAEHYPITKAIYELYQRLGEGQFIASALGVWAMALLVVTILATSVLLGRRMGAVFRL